MGDDNDDDDDDDEIKENAGGQNSTINNDANTNVDISFIIRSHTGCHLSRTTYERSGNSVTHLYTNPNALPPISSTMKKATARTSKRRLLQFTYDQPRSLVVRVSYY
jgi:hypothetical protein